MVENDVVRHDDVACDTAHLPQQPIVPADEILHVCDARIVVCALRIEEGFALRAATVSFIESDGAAVLASDDRDTPVQARNGKVFRSEGLRAGEHIEAGFGSPLRPMFTFPSQAN